MSNPCPSCNRDRVPESIGHRHTGTQCFWCMFNSDRDALPEIKLEPGWLGRDIARATARLREWGVAPLFRIPTET